MARVIRVDEVEVSIVVVSGTGTATFDEAGRIDALLITVPSGTPTFNVEILTRNNRGVYARSGNSGSTNMKVDRLIPSGGNKVKLSTVSADGTYTATLWIDRGF